MSLKILGGVLKGFEIQLPQNETTKPTAVLLRRKIFDRYQDLKGTVFIDLCAGSGAMGLEALSRGADSVVLIEKDPQMAKNLKQTINRLSSRSGAADIVKKVSIIQMDVTKWLKQQFVPDGNSQVICFFDPPYGDVKLYKDVLDLLSKNHQFSMLWLEYDHKQLAAAEILKPLNLLEVKSYEHAGHQLKVLKFNQTD